MKVNCGRQPQVPRDVEIAIHQTAKCTMECQCPKHTSQDYPKAALSSDLMNSGASRTPRSLHNTPPISSR
ncbi:hypothetical protein TNCT_177421 [Trichonephila clavata]|uniref:Uncharacterized protein n=1 Tax=Trichonephila clavata TaxID=2740835 RepID=A0A8X6HML5_TRICU|nr:hypothetical protein TNCT_177421 [Trichonephila clavata]